MPRGAILFDFDGTLVDTRQASWEVFAETNELFGLGVDSRDAFFGIFQNNFHESFAKLSDDGDLIRRAKDHFMAALNERYRPSLIPGIVDVIRALTPAFTLAVVSSNGMPVIRRVLTDAGVATCFSHVFSGDVQPSKSAVIEQFTADHSYASLRHCTPSYVDAAPPTAVPDDATFMVTDTVGDVEEARRVGIRAVGVCWGMHDEASLLAAGAETVMVWPQELIAFFGAAADDIPETCRIGPGGSAPDARHDSCSADSCHCSTAAETGRCSAEIETCSCSTNDDNAPGPADIRSTRRLRTRRAATAATAPAAVVAAPSIRPVVRPDRRQAVDPELVEALRLTAVP